MYGKYQLTRHLLHSAQSDMHRMQDKQENLFADGKGQSDLGTVFAVLSVLVISVKHLMSAVFPSPNVRCALHSPGNWSCHVT